MMTVSTLDSKVKICFWFGGFASKHVMRKNNLESESQFTQINHMCIESSGEHIILTF